MTKVVRATCPHDCPDACSVLITVDDGRATKIRGDSEHPVTRGFLCGKVAKYVERVYSPDRLLYPMKRVAPKGERGEQAFTRITWDEALETIATRFHAIAAQFGSEAILPYSYGGTLGTIHGSTMDHRFFHRLGASQLERSICSNAGEAGLLSVTGIKMGTEPEQFARSRYIIAWGANIHGNNIHLWPFIEEARRQGAKLVVIDPYRTRTARAADWHIAINPGTDVALAMAMMNVIVSEGLCDADFIAKHTNGFEELRQSVADFTPERASESTGICADDIRKLAREYAMQRPAVIRMNYGVQRCENGGAAVRAIAMLPCITGSWKEVGGGLVLSTSGAAQLNRKALKRPDLMIETLGREARVLNMSELGSILNDATLAPPVKALFVFNSNPAAVCPDQRRVLEGLRSEDLFTVVHEQFLTDTTAYADIVLPATTFFEHRDLVTAYGHYYVQHSEQAIAPLGEARSNADVFRALAAKVGFDDACLFEDDDTLIETALASEHAHLAGITREALVREHSIRLRLPDPCLPFAKGFATPSGKAELGAVVFVPPQESRHGELSAKYPLEFLPRKADNWLNSTFCNLPGHRKMETEPALEIHPEDAAARGIAEGDTVRLFNARGKLRLKARLSTSIQQGVVAAKLDWNRDGKNVNLLTSPTLTDMGGGPTFYSTLVEVEKA